jgi:hypothetical protein
MKQMVWFCRSLFDWTTKRKIHVNSKSSDVWIFLVADWIMHLWVITSALITRASSILGTIKGGMGRVEGTVVSESSADHGSPNLSTPAGPLPAGRIRRGQSRGEYSFCPFQPIFEILSNDLLCCPVWVILYSDNINNLNFFITCKSCHFFTLLNSLLNCLKWVIRTVKTFDMWLLSQRKVHCHQRN